MSGSQAALLAEVEVTNALRENLSSTTLVRSNVVLPNHSSQGRREIDILVASASAVVVIEVKHWSGCVSRSDADTFKQARRSGDSLLHEDPTQVNRVKCKLLQKYLESRAVIPPEGFFHSLVVFSNENCFIEGELLKDPAIVLPSPRHQNLINRVTQLTSPEGWLWSAAATVGLVSSASLIPYTWERLRVAVEGIPRWDVLVLRNDDGSATRVIGDYKGVVLDGKQLEFTLKDVTVIRCEKQESLLSSLGVSSTVVALGVNEGMWSYYVSSMLLPAALGEPDSWAYVSKLSTTEAAELEFAPAASRTSKYPLWKVKEVHLGKPRS